MCFNEDYHPICSWVNAGINCALSYKSGLLITTVASAATIIDTATVIKDFAINPVALLVSMAVGVIFASVFNHTFTDNDETPDDHGVTYNNMRFSAASVTVGIIPSLLTLGNNVNSIAVKFFFGSYVSGFRMGAMAAIAYWHAKSTQNY